MIKKIKKAYRIAQIYPEFRQHKTRFGRVPVYIDIGARGGIPAIWKHLAKMKYLEVTAFEPEISECERLKEAQPYIKWFPYALGDQKRIVDFYITADPACSSCLEPDDRILSKYPVRDKFVVSRTEQFEIHSYEDLFDAGLVPLPHILKMDVQGFEYPVIEGMGKCLESVICIEAESHFKAIYHGEKSFEDLKCYLEHRSFILSHLEPHGNFGKELVEANLFFIRKPSTLSDEQLSIMHLWELLCELPHNRLNMP